MQKVKNIYVLAAIACAPIISATSALAGGAGF